MSEWSCSTGHEVEEQGGENRRRLVKIAHQRRERRPLSPTEGPGCVHNGDASS